MEDEDGERQHSVNDEKCDSAPNTVEVTFDPTQPVAAPREHISEPEVETEVETELAETEGDQLETSGEKADGGRMTLPLDLRLSLVPDGRCFVRRFLTSRPVSICPKLSIETVSRFIF